MDVLPIPPAPMRAMDVKFLVRQMIFSITSSRPKQAGSGGGNSPGGILDVHVRLWTILYSRSLTWVESEGW